MTRSVIIALEYSSTESCRFSLELKCANRPLLDMPRCLTIRQSCKLSSPFSLASANALDSKYTLWLSFLYSTLFTKDKSDALFLARSFFFQEDFLLIYWDSISLLKNCGKCDSIQRILKLAKFKEKIMNTLWEQFAFSASVTGPICLMLFLGVMLKQGGLINDNFIDVASKVFQSPYLQCCSWVLFSRVHDFSTSSTLVLFAFSRYRSLFSWLLPSRPSCCFRDSKDQGVIIQGGFQG